MYVTQFGLFSDEGVLRCKGRLNNALLLVNPKNPILLPFWWDYLAILHQISLLLVLTVRHLFYFHLLTFLLFIFLHSYSSFKCKQTAKISMCKKKEGMFTPLRLNNLDVLPQETLWVSFMLTCCNWLFTLWWAKGFSLKIPFCKQLWVFQYFIKIFLGNYIQNNCT